MNPSYEDDFYGWTLDQIDKLQKKDIEQIDFEHLIEEVKSLGNSERKALKSHTTKLLLHLLKCEYQREFRTRSWDISIRNARVDIAQALKENPSLKNRLNEIITEAYQKARIEASDETYLDESFFPITCPWSFEEMMDMEKK